MLFYCPPATSPSVIVYVSVIVWIIVDFCRLANFPQKSPRSKNFAYILTECLVDMNQILEASTVERNVSGNMICLRRQYKNHRILREESWHTHLPLHQMFPQQTYNFYLLLTSVTIIIAAYWSYSDPFIQPDSSTMAHSHHSHLTEVNRQHFE